MEKMIGYIFGSLKNTDDAIKEIGKCLRQQNKLNRRFAIYTLATVAWLYVSEKRHEEEKEALEKELNAQEQMIDMLNDDIRELKTMKGEHKM